MFVRIRKRIQIYFSVTYLLMEVPKVPVYIKEIYLTQLNRVGFSGRIINIDCTAVKQALGDCIYGLAWPHQSNRYPLNLIEQYWRQA